MFANKLKVGQHRDHRQFADVDYYGLYHQNNSKNRIYKQLAFRNIYFVGVSFDSLHTISVGKQTPILLPLHVTLGLIRGLNFCNAEGF